MKRKRRPTRKPGIGKAERARRDLNRKNAITLVSQDIGELPKVKDPERRARCKASFGLFCRTYLPSVFFLDWSKDLQRVVAKVELVVIEHQKLAVAMPRGSGKTALCRAAVLWAILYGYHRYAMLIAATAKKSADTMEVIKAWLEKNELLMADFPEVCYPIRKLDNEPRKRRGQRYKGLRTDITWARDRIVLPTIPGSAVSGSIIDAASMEGEIRGPNLSLPDGSSARPTLAMCDDPQTDESARSQGEGGQTANRLKTILQSVQGLAGPSATTAILVPCTVIEAGDLADQLLQRPDFRGERTRRLYAWPSNLEGDHDTAKDLWEQYRELRNEVMRSGRPLSEATAFYAARCCNQGRKLDESAAPCLGCPNRRTCMDCGAVVDWAERMDRQAGEISSLQSAMHSFYTYGPAGFAAEFQNEPLTGDTGSILLTAAACAARFNGRPAREVPLDCTELTMGVDVQQSSLWYVMTAWRPDFTGSVIDYGVWPAQTRRIFTLREIVDSRNNLQTAYPGRGVEGTIQAGLEEFIGRALATDFRKAGGGGLMRLSRVLVDSGKWPGVIAAVKRKVGGATMMLSRGLGIRAGHKPLSSLKRKPGERHGDHWYIPNVTGTREFPHVAIDVNYWKSFVHSGFLTAPGDPGALTLFGDGAELHGLFASHITAETYVRTTGHGREVCEWTIRPQRPDNHWLDAKVLAAVAASMQGVKHPSREPAPRPGVVIRKRVSIDQLLARRETVGA